MSFCPACGSALAAEAQVCTNCGAKVVPAAMQPAGQAAQPKSKGCGRIALFFLVIFLLVVVGIGGLSYWGYNKIKPKVVEKLQQAKNKIMKPEGSKTIANPNEKTEEPCPPSDFSALSLDRGTIPMKVGLTLATSWTIKRGDYETLMQIQSIDNSAVTTTCSGPSANNPNINVQGKRNVCLVDLRDGSLYVTAVASKFAETIRGATMFSLSRSEFNALKNSGSMKITYYNSAWRTGHGKYVLGAEGSGTISRIEPNDVSFGVIVNDQRMELPTIHAKGTLGPYATEFNILDDVNNPIVLYFAKPQIRFQIKILKISYPEERKIEKQLAEEGKVQVYGIYFDFNSANIRQESEPVLKEIADALNAHPDWKLSVNGHTDNIGGASYNMRLSDRRAAAVKQALIDRYNITPDRLTTAGFGMSQPIETNDTPEGRARNRRVELVKK